MEFEWDDAKAAIKHRKHRVSFHEGRTRIISARKATANEVREYEEC